MEISDLRHQLSQFQKLRENNFTSDEVNNRSYCIRGLIGKKINLANWQNYCPNFVCFPIKSHQYHIIIPMLHT